ncbi:MAG: Uma2 family endonuclease [Verrucomicrobiaceae bacterium]|nr:MAG: Uma2 family endonuclease [Verrucomicrobiaceae bacterium]
MTALRKEDLYLTPEEYLAAERVTQTKHEYLAGVVYAMAGASRTHNLIAGNIFGELRNQLRGRKCVPFGSDMRLRIRSPRATFYYYPDVAVECSETAGDEIEEPTVIFEVLSPDTERSDRGDKLVNYQNIPTMRVYVLVDQYKAAVTVFRRGEGDAWDMDVLGSIEDTLALPEISCSLPLRAMYERVLKE